MDLQEIQSRNHRVIMNRFVAACQADERVGAATLYGTFAKGAADAYSEQATYCLQEPRAMLQAAFVIVCFYQELAPLLARRHGITYPADLERLMSERLNTLCDARLS